MNKTYPIVIGQTNDSSLKLIQRGIERILSGREPPNKIIYAQYASEVISQTIETEARLVIVGQRFYDEDITQMGRGLVTAVAAYLGVDEARAAAQADHIRRQLNGTQISEKLYERDPSIIVLRYSLSGGERGKFVGDINKDRTDLGLAELVTSEELAPILAEKDWDRFERTFPQVTCYPGWRNGRE